MPAQASRPRSTAKYRFSFSTYRYPRAISATSSGPGRPSPSKGFTHLFTIMDRTSRWPEALPIAATQQLTVRMLCFRGGLADSASGGSSHQTAVSSSPPPCGPPCATCLTYSMLLLRQQLTTHSLKVWWNAFMAAPKTRSRSAATRRTGQTSCPGSYWASAQWPEKKTTHPLRRCSAHHSFYLVNFLITLNFLQIHFLVSFLVH
jgi:hypothetical protein